jgi:hypothetical protein
LLFIYKQEQVVHILGQYISEKIRLLAFRHQDIWTLHNLNIWNHSTLYEQWSWKQITEKNVTLSLYTTYRHIWGDDVYIYAFILHLSNSRNKLNITK